MPVIKIMRVAPYIFKIQQIICATEQEQGAVLSRNKSLRQTDVDVPVGWEPFRVIRIKGFVNAQLTSKENVI